LRATGAAIGVDERVVINAARRMGAALDRPLVSRLSRIDHFQTTDEALQCRVLR
jgi:hypothetical protein